jgi:drug/metabolite transporter (DMT)-like permease
MNQHSFIIMSSSSSSVVTASDWIKGIGLSILASMIGGASKLAIRKSWLLEQQQQQQALDEQQEREQEHQQHPPEQHQVWEETPNDDEGEETVPLPKSSSRSTTSCDILNSNNDYYKPPLPLISSILQEEDSSSRVRYNSINHNTIGEESDNNSNNNDTSEQYQVFDIETTHPKMIDTAEVRRRKQRRASCCCPGGPCGSSCGGHDDDHVEEEEEEGDDGVEHEQARQPDSRRHRTKSNSNIAAYTLRGAGMMGMTVFNPLVCVLAMNYASPSILAPFSGLTLVWIISFSQPCLGEQPTTHQVVAASLIVLGEVVVAVYGDHTNGIDDDNEETNQDSLEALRQSYVSVPFLLYLAALVLWMLLLFYWIKSTTSSPTLKRFSWGVAGGSVTGLQNFLKDSLTIVKILKKQQQPPKEAQQSSSYEDITSATYSSTATLSSSSSSSSLQQVQIFGFPWYLPVMIFMAMVTAFGGLLLLTACMKRYDATYSSAMFVGSFVVSATIMSAVHYNTFAHLQPSIVNYVLYPAGLVILMSGIWMLIHEKHEQEQEENNHDYHRHLGLVSEGGGGEQEDEATPCWMTTDTATLSSSNEKETTNSSYATCTGSEAAGSTVQGQGGLTLMTLDDDHSPEDHFVDEDDRSISPRRKEMVCVNTKRSSS